MLFFYFQKLACNGLLNNFTPPFIPHQLKFHTWKLLSWPWFPSNLSNNKIWYFIMQPYNGWLIYKKLIKFEITMLMFYVFL